VLIKQSASESFKQWFTPLAKTPEIRGGTENQKKMNVAKFKKQTIKHTLETNIPIDAVDPQFKNADVLTPTQSAETLQP
jgi:hypothetical protein